MSQLYIGTIIESEYEIAKEVVREAFLNVEHTDGNEHELIGKIRKTKSSNYSSDDVSRLDSRLLVVVIVCHSMFRVHGFRLA